MTTAKNCEDAPASYEHGRARAGAGARGDVSRAGGTKFRTRQTQRSDTIATVARSVERSDTVVCCDGIPIGTVADVVIDGDRLTDFVVYLEGRPVRIPIGAAVRASNGRVDLMLRQADVALLSTANVDDDR